jgi:3-oxoadipate enol-lactonase
VPFVTAGGVRHFLIDEGDGPPLVFVHGFPLDHSLWDAQRREFRTHYRVLAPDLRGFGRSEVAVELPGGLDDFADDLAAILDAVDVRQPITLCGLSMGGYIALAFWRRHRSRIDRLVLCHTKSTADSPEAAAQRVDLATKVLQDGPRVVAEAMMPRLFGSRTNEDQPAVVDRVRHVMLATTSRGIAAAQHAMARRPDSTGQLPEMALSTLVICGAEDRISTPEEMRSMAGLLPHSQYVEIPGAGHLSPLEKPAQFNAALRPFLPNG